MSEATSFSYLENYLVPEYNKYVILNSNPLSHIYHGTHYSFENSKYNFMLESINKSKT